MGHGVDALDPRPAPPGEPPRSRAFAGYAGWAPGQLENEIRRGDWLLAPPDPARALDPKPAALWQKLFAIASGRWI